MTSKPLGLDLSVSEPDKSDPDRQQQRRRLREIAELCGNVLNKDTQIKFDIDTLLKTKVTLVVEGSGQCQEKEVGSTTKGKEVLEEGSSEKILSQDVGVACDTVATRGSLVQSGKRYPVVLDRSKKGSGKLKKSENRFAILSEAVADVLEDNL